MNHNSFAILTAVWLFALAPLSFGQDSKDQEALQLAQKAQDLAKAQKFEDAFAAMKKATQLVPNNHLYLAVTSDYALKAGKVSEARELVQQAIKLNGKVGSYYVLAALAELADQELDKALDYCELVLKRGEKELGSQAVKDAAVVKDALVKKTYTLNWNLDPKFIRYTGGTIAIALPKHNPPYQIVTWEVSGVKSQRFVKGEVNDILYVVPQGAKPFSLVTKVTIQPHSFKKELASTSAAVPLPAEAKAHLGPCFSINPKSPVLTKIVADLKGATNADTARNILAWMKKNVEYKLEKGSIAELDFKTVDELAQRGHAECRGYAMLFTALCRAADIPARPIFGLMRMSPGQEQRFGDIAPHNWAEFYAPGVGWVAVDPQKAETLGCLPNRCIRIFMDAKKTKASTEGLPLLNLMYMNGEKLKFDESR
jgi:tetratricopeptide (TPR) repeat protein